MPHTNKDQGGVEEIRLDFPHQDDNNWLSIEVGETKYPQYPSPLEVKMLLHQELQKARESWLREEIVKLKKKMQYPCQHGPSDSCDTDCMYQDTEEKMFIRLGHNQALQTIIDRYLFELDQPTKLSNCIECGYPVPEYEEVSNCHSTCRLEV